MKVLKISLLMALISCTTVVGQFKLPTLPYSYNALEPYIDSTTMYIHYNMHHATYTTNLNKALEKYPELYKKSAVELLRNLSALPTEIQTQVRNSGGGYYNHCFFWSILAPAGTTSISPKLEKILVSNFGSIDKFKAEFEKAAISRFGSGWAWVVKDTNGRLLITSTANQDSPLLQTTDIKGNPVLTLDVWEHAYYLKYQSKRAAYIKAFWNIVNWNEVEKQILE